VQRSFRKGPPISCDYVKWLHGGSPGSSFILPRFEYAGTRKSLQLEVLHPLEHRTAYLEVRRFSFRDACGPLGTNSLVHLLAMDGYL